MSILLGLLLFCLLPAVFADKVEGLPQIPLNPDIKEITADIRNNARSVFNAPDMTWELSYFYRHYDKHTDHTVFAYKLHASTTKNLEAGSYLILGANPNCHIVESEPFGAEWAIDTASHVIGLDFSKEQAINTVRTYYIKVNGDAEMDEISFALRDSRGLYYSKGAIYGPACLAPVDCDGHWTEWDCPAPCFKLGETPGHGIARRDFKIVSQARNDGFDCDYCDGTVQTKYCVSLPCPIDCEEQWSEWKCNVECGEGNMQRVNNVTTHPRYGGKECQFPDKAIAVKESCEAPIKCPIDCVGAWTEFGHCDAMCEKQGLQYRFYDITVPAQHKGKECPFPHHHNESRVCDGVICPVDCKYEWSKWNKCNAPCNVHGLKNRTLTIIANEVGAGKVCPDVDGAIGKEPCFEPCPIDCVGKWGDWACSAKCDGEGVMSREYEVVIRTAYGGKSCPYFDRQVFSSPKPCVGAPCPERCAPGPWMPWGDCNCMPGAADLVKGVALPPVSAEASVSIEPAQPPALPAATLPSFGATPNLDPKGEFAKFGVGAQGTKGVITGFVEESVTVTKSTTFSSKKAAPLFHGMRSRFRMVPPHCEIDGKPIHHAMEEGPCTCEQETPAPDLDELMRLTGATLPGATAKSGDTKADVAAKKPTVATVGDVKALAEAQRAPVIVRTSNPLLNAFLPKTQSDNPEQQKVVQAALTTAAGDVAAKAQTEGEQKLAPSLKDIVDSSAELKQMPGMPTIPDASLPKPAVFKDKVVKKVQGEPQKYIQNPHAKGDHTHKPVDPEHVMAHPHKYGGEKPTAATVKPDGNTQTNLEEAAKARGTASDQPSNTSPAVATAPATAAPAALVAPAPATATPAAAAKSATPVASPAAAAHTVASKKA